jgi:hypothetical protein
VVRGGGPDFGSAVEVAPAADGVPIAVGEPVDDGISARTPGAMDAGLSDEPFRSALPGGFAVAFLVTAPVGKWTTGRGKGRAVVHAHHRERRHAARTQRQLDLPAEESGGFRSMRAMTGRAQRHRALPPLGRWRALLVLGLLAGLFGMHALAPGGVHHEHAEPRHGVTVAVGAHDGCPGGCGTDHAQHADPTCASGAVSGGPTLPGLVPDPVAAPASDDVVCAYAVSPPDGARAPPSLAELQLLRI